MTGIIIDEINANILRTLLVDARTSFTKMAKENNISIVAVRNRYENLIKTGVIEGAIMQINPYYLGLNCIGFLGLTVKSENIEETKDFLNKQPYTTFTWDRGSQKNIGAFFATPDLEYLNSVNDRLKSKKNIEKTETLIFLGFLSNQHPENLVIKSDIVVQKENSKEEKHINQNFENKKFITTDQIRQLNQLDRIIAKKLSNDARVSFRQIGKQLKISTSNVIKRYHNLRENNLLLRPTISVDLRKLGYRSRILVYFNIRIGTQISELQKRLFKIPNLIVLTKTLGQTDMLAIFPVSTFEEFYKLKRTVYDISEIEVVQIDVTPTGAKWPQNLFGNIL